MLVVVARRRSLPAPTSTARIDRPRPPLLYVANACFKCFKRLRGMLQLFNMDVAKIDWRCLHMLHMLQVFQMHVAGVCSKRFISCKRSDLNVAYVSHVCCNIMFQIF
jgi:hypothetical protein